MLNDLRWIVALWFIELALFILPADDDQAALVTHLHNWSDEIMKNRVDIY